MVYIGIMVPCGFEDLIKENQFSVFYIFRCSGIVLLFPNGLMT